MQCSKWLLSTFENSLCIVRINVQDLEKRMSPEFSVSIIYESSLIVLDY